MQSEQKYAIKCRLLLSVNTRHSAQASEKVLKMAAADSSGYIVGVDLSGPPVEDLNISTIVHVLRGAKSTGLKVSAHICEIDESKGWSKDTVHEFRRPFFSQNASRILMLYFG